MSDFAATSRPPLGQNRSRASVWRPLTAPAAGRRSALLLVLPCFVLLGWWQGVGELGQAGLHGVVPGGGDFPSRCSSSSLLRRSASFSAALPVSPLSTSRPTCSSFFSNSSAVLPSRRPACRCSSSTPKSAARPADAPVPGFSAELSVAVVLGARLEVAPVPVLRRAIGRRGAGSGGIAGWWTARSG